VQVTMMLADAAQVANGKLFILGGGWSVTGPEPSPSAIVLKIAVPWDQANKSHHLVLSLIDTDGNPLTASDPAGQQQPFRIEADFEAGRPTGIAPGTPLDVPVALNLGPIPLMPGGRYVWVLSIDGHTDEDWRLPFTVRPMATAPTSS
jgi:hypothetical protein